MAGDADRLSRLQLLTDAALAHLDLEQLLSALLARAREMLEVDTCAVLLLDEEAGELVARAAVGLEEEVERGVRLPIGSGFAGRVAAERRAVILDDVDHADVLNPVLLEKGIKSLLGVPLLVGGKVIGVLHVGVLRRRVFTPADVELLQLAADRAALAIDHARTYEAEKRARERLEGLQAVADVALTHLELEELLAVLLPRIRTILNADTCAVLLLDEEAGELVARAAVGIEEEVERGVRIPVGRGFAGRIAALRQPVVIDDVDHAEVLNPILREKGIRSLCGVPLLVGGEPIGVLHVGTLRHRTFAPDDIEMLELVAERVALSIERARMHEQGALLDELKENFIAFASHELRTPAASVYGVLNTLASRDEDLPRELRKELLQTGLEEGDRLRRLLEELADLSRLQTQAIKVAAKPLVVRIAVESIAKDAVPQGTPLTFDVPDDLTAVADPAMLDRVLSSLLANAVRHGEPPYVVAAKQTEWQVRIAVCDHGPGVPDELLPRLFEPFARGEDVRGNGLGLAVSRSYARAHGGDLVYDPSGRGARFELILPRRS